ncbi:MAG: hypothetical protein CMF62_03185 [Magnetococcales bacterium]|nr:hypothetical protein [Magnetococcales bacterium]|tara:strand:+ start:6300 stop:7070 length:771 start_codon:yes stop_codon:yes gene_type:complete
MSKITNSEIKPFIIEDGNNTSYISSLLVSLYFVSSPLDRTFKRKLSSGYSYYLQEFINRRFVIPIKKAQSVDFSTINALRNVLFLGEWKDYTKWINNHNIKDLYKYLMQEFKEPCIELIDSNNKKSQVDYLEFNCENINDNIEIKHILDSVLADKYICNIPTIIPIYLKNKNFQLDIQKKIFLNNKYYFHSMVCKEDNGHYYTFLYHKQMDEFIIFSDNSVPCMTILKRENNNIKKIIEKIKKDCKMVFYLLDKSI